MLVVFILLSFVVIRILYKRLLFGTIKIYTDYDETYTFMELKKDINKMRQQKYILLKVKDQRFN